MSALDTNSGNRTHCPVCGNFILPYMEYCNPCQEQKDRIDEMRRQRKRDEAFGNVWEEVGKRRWTI